MGITKEMYIDYAIEENIIADPISKENYLNLWNDIMGKTVFNEN